MSISRKFTEEQLRSSITHACKKLKIDKPYKQQEICLLSYLRGHDLIVALPTSAGKSLIFEAAPFCWDYLHKIASRGTDQSVSCTTDIPERHSALVVSPLKSLMNTQVAELTEKGINAVALLKETTSDIYADIGRGKYSIIFASPEILQKKGPSLLSNPVFRERVCGIFVDEVHVVKQWGHDGGSTKAFRQDYALLSELRSLVPSKVPVCALTATATSETISVITTSLALKDTALFTESPDRENIKLVVYHTKETDPAITFNWLADELKEKGKECDRHIVYCRSHNDCTKLYGFFEKQIGRFSNRLEQTYAMYHATTDKKVQDAVIDSFRNPDGSIRVLFATTAFGMGVDVKQVYTIIHYGPPKSISEYVQESGRAGRDKKESTSLLIHYTGSTSKSKCDKNMKDFLKVDNKCRRELILQHFNVEKGEWALQQHRCCDICSKQCKCNGETCGEKKALCETSVTEQTPRIESTVVHQREVNQVHREQLHQRLNTYREYCLLVEECKDNHLYSGKDIASGVPRKTLDKVVQECNLELNFEQFNKRYTLFDTNHARHIWDIIQDVVGNCNRLPGHEEEESRDITISMAIDIDPHIDDHDEDSEEELTLQAIIHSSSDSESD
ncbi:probable ATP-dependent DNA helicase RecS [Amphiura filiformis]|uniref:probable ATP-dependent DNA helicase RecS n=1 Tax=Amphiura filiformis TaxID=82378 RepID=UPI003B22425F